MLQSYNNINTNGYYKPNVKDVKYHYENLELKDFLKVLPGKKEIDIYAERRGEKSWKCFCPLSHNHKVGYDVKPSLIVTEKSAEQVQREQEKIDQNPNKRGMTA